MQGSRTISEDVAFACEHDDLERLANLLATRVGPMSWKLEWSDRIDRQGDDLAKLLEFVNSSRQEVRDIQLWARSEDRERHVSIGLGRGFSNIYTSIEGPVEFVQQFSAVLEAQLSGFRPWYARVARLDFVDVGFGILFSLFAVVVLLTALGLVGTDDRSSDPTARGQALLYTVIGVVVVIGWLLNKARERRFPMTTFALGQGKRRYQTLEKVRWTVVVGFIVSVGAGVVVLALPW